MQQIADNNLIVSAYFQLMNQASTKDFLIKVSANI